MSYSGWLYVFHNAIWYNVFCRFFCGLRRFVKKNVAKCATFDVFIWLFDDILVILSHNLRRYTLYNVALKDKSYVYT